ncbi:MAG TPA: glycerophosphodiester phosphodiesterase family protein [Dongiaceae bacterium]|jgi:glycerophosphoryl diester phosphodiesterase
MTAIRPVPPIAHRGLHDESRGIIENTASAFRAAIAGRYAIETDIQAAAGGEPVIFHDATLDRLTAAEGPLSAHTAAALAKIPMRGTSDRIMTLEAFLALVGGRVPLFLEIKALGGSDRTLERRVAEALADYHGPVSVISFDPGSLIAIREAAPEIPRGLTAMRYFKHPKNGLDEVSRFRLTHMLDVDAVKPDFLTYEVNDLAVMGPALRRRFPGLPILTWTVRTREDRRKAERFADGIIFEGFTPSSRERADQ